MPDNFTFIAHFEAKPGSEKRLQQALLDCVPPSLAEEGCLAYRPYVDLAEPLKAILVERWKDNASLEYHFSTDHFQKLQRVFNEVLVRPFAADMLVDSDEVPPSP